MKCPHCHTGIHRGFAKSLVASEVAQYSGAAGLHGVVLWSALQQRCPECLEHIIVLERQGPKPDLSFTAYPQSATRPIPPEVPEPYRTDFGEACAVFPISPKASAALSRRTLQALLKDRLGANKKDLYDQIEEVVSSGKLPSHIADGLHVVRNIGNFAAHPMKSTSTGTIAEVEPGEAEWNLDVIESLFDFCFVAPAADAKRKAELNKKLKDLGKPTI